MSELNKEKLNKVQIEQHLKSAVSSLAPDVLDRIDLTAKQEETVSPSRITMMNRRLKVLAGAMAACLCLVFLSGGGYFIYQNERVESVIGIDVNPSIELSVNRKNRVLDATPLNQDAVEIIDNMDLAGVHLDVAVNAVIGSMVKHGYLDDVDNAILVTVSNDSIKKADNLRQTVVGDIQDSLRENQVEAVVYDQQAVQVDEVQKLAEQYGISYGKAYFLKELVAQNPALTMEDMEALAPLTMEQIAAKIVDGNYALAGAGVEAPTKATLATTAAVSLAEETTAQESTTQETTTLAESVTVQNTPTAQPSVAPPAPATTSIPTETTQEVVAEKNEIQIDNVDYDSGVVYVSFSSKVKWNNPTVSVKDSAGNSYAAMIGDTDSKYCEILISGLEEGETYSFVIGGIRKGSLGKSTTVKGSFETPVISSEATEAPSGSSENGVLEDTELENDSSATDTKPVPTQPSEPSESATAPSGVVSSQ